MSEHYVGADGQSYPEIAAQAVRSVAAQHRSPYYGYLRTGVNQSTTCSVRSRTCARGGTST